MSQFKQYWSDISQKDKTDLFISFCVILLTAIFILYYAFPSAKTQEPHLLKNNVKLSDVKPPDTFIINKKVYQRVDVTTDEGKGHQKQIYNEPNIIKEPTSTVYIDTTVAVVSDIEDTSHSINVDGIDSTNLRMYSDSIISDNTYDSIDVETITEDLDEKVIIDSSNLLSKRDTFMLESHDEKNALKQNLSDRKQISEDCIILIGTYHSDENALNMQARLESAGYNVFFVKNSRHTKVGTYVSCNKESIRISLQDIRKEFAKDAFLYRRK